MEYNGTQPFVGGFQACHCRFNSYAQKINGHLPGCGIINEEVPYQENHMNILDVVVESVKRVGAEVKRYQTPEKPECIYVFYEGKTYALICYEVVKCKSNSKKTDSLST
jgi:hypothetical protein